MCSCQVFYFCSFLSVHLFFPFNCLSYPSFYLSVCCPFCLPSCLSFSCFFFSSFHSHVFPIVFIHPVLFVRRWRSFESFCAIADVFLFHFVFRFSIPFQCSFKCGPRAPKPLSSGALSSRQCTTQFAVADYCGTGVNSTWCLIYDTCMFCEMWFMTRCRTCIFVWHRYFYVMI